MNMNDETINLAMLLTLTGEAQAMWAKLLKKTNTRSAMTKMAAMYAKKKTLSELIREKESLKFDPSKENISHAMSRFDFLAEETTMDPEDHDKNSRDHERRLALFKFIGPELAQAVKAKQLRKMQKGTIWSTDDLIDYADELLQNKMALKKETIQLNNLRMAQSPDAVTHARREKALSATRQRREEDRDRIRERNRSPAPTPTPQGPSRSQTPEPMSVKSISEEINKGNMQLIHSIVPTKDGITINNHKDPILKPHEISASSIRVNTDQPVFIFSGPANERRRYWSANSGQWRSRTPSLNRNADNRSRRDNYRGRYNMNFGNVSSWQRNRTPTPNRADPHNQAIYAPKSN